MENNLNSTIDQLFKLIFEQFNDIKINENIPELPKLKKDRIKDMKYMYEDEIRIWNGKELKCIHNRKKSQCKECHGGSICEHKRQKSYCKECKGSQICKHKRVRSKCKECHGGSICEHKKERTTCKECKGGSICEHNKRRTRCKECHGGSICEHNRIRSECKDCGGSQICEHNKIRSVCKECGGSQICEHNRIKYFCKECGGKGICQHNKVRSVCKECGGGQICEHKRVRSKCKDCGGSQICEHNKIRSVCKECHGGHICEHNRIRSKCKDCGGSQICEHNKIRSVCKECKGGGICIHNRSRTMCKECHGGHICEHEKARSICPLCSPNSNSLCKHCKKIIINISNYKPYCYHCFIKLNPDCKLSKNHKHKEIFINNFLSEEFKNDDIKIIYNKPIQTELSKRSPDWLIDQQSYTIIIECDENQHRSYTDDDERTEELYEALGSVNSLVMIRINPDKNSKGEYCFDIINGKVIPVDKIWNQRKKELIDLIRLHMKEVPEERLIELYIGYD